MGTYMGNVGHLMQHWTLCEILAAAQPHHSGLNYIDAHAMAPLAAEPEDPAKVDAHFAWVQRNLPGRESRYEQAWHHLVPQGLPEYPSSAAFVQQVWNGRCSLLLCEANPKVAAEIQVGIPDADLFAGDWRQRFADRLPNPPDSLTLVSFDPYMYSTHTREGLPKEKPGNLYPADLKLVRRSLNGFEASVLIQLSTYSNNGGNSQSKVICSADSILKSCDFENVAVVKANIGSNRRMMSLVYARNVEWAADLAGLPSRFKEWLSKIPKSQAAA